ncbi:hypothetical protein DE146DRAFT_764505 [Phaeosphaeria sp. MPI-PUGE-AT-0046c]|nr:hypothetical protein DE146DRAFT_764505 [Phaeosphaeria sp. MPI-PUGE-AT-0046c]
MHSVFQIPELLMHIVLCLDPKDICACSSVSPHWRATIKTHLPPSLQSLPDSQQKLSRAPLPTAIRDFATSIQIQDESCILSEQMLELGDEYLCWGEGKHAEVLEKIKPQLHPFLASTATVLISGLDSVAKGYLEICLQTKCTQAEFAELFQNEEWHTESMTMPYVRSVEIYVARGAKWDLGHNSVLLRGRLNWARHMVRVERKKGVRMGDVVDELRGSLVPEMSDYDDQSIVLEWVFES